MTRMVTAVLLCTALLGASRAEAAPSRLDARSILRAMGAADVVPAQWAGIWSVVDSTYNCEGVLQQVTSSTDTICAGQELTEESPDPTVQFDCTSSATGNTYEIRCTGFSEVFPDCRADFVMDAEGTFSGDSYSSVMTMTVTYSGTGEGCDLLPPYCLQINSHGTRTGPAPTEYCSTAALPSTWGGIKAIYR